jgi:DNA repair exonuclease SbcCD nuclease subunit
MKFLHTADWQIGMKCMSAGVCAADARAVRLKTAASIVRVANERQLDFILIAGDLFDNQTPRAADVGEVVELLRRATMPVYVLPGNHDPAGQRGPFASPAWAALRGSHVTTIEQRGVIELPGGELLATPCERKYSCDDPTGWFEEHHSTSGNIRVGIAHGALRVGDIGKPSAGDQRGNFPIDTNAAARAELDYLALGDWHSYMVYPNGNALISYSGTPEPTAFGERDSGTISIVSIESHGAKPQIDRVETAGLRWLQRSFEVSDERSIDLLDADLRAIPEPKRSLVRVTVNGLCSPAAAQQLRALEPVFAARFFCYAMFHEYAARPETRDAWLALLPFGHYQTLATELLDRIERNDGAALAKRALDKLAEYAR